MSKRLLKSTLIFGLMTFISRIFGLIRDIVIANVFGAGHGSDAFFVAFKIPNYLRRLFAEGAFSQAFVPVLTEYKTKQDREAVQDLIDNVSGRLGLILIIISILGVIAAPLIISVFATGFLMNYPDKFDLAVALLRITFPYIMFISLTALAGGILNTYGRFGIPAFTPVFLNISLIVCAIWLSPYFAEPVTALAWGVFIAGFVQLMFQLPFLFRLKLFPKPNLKKNHPGVKRIIYLMIPTLFAVSVSQINLIIDMLIASFLQTGSISWLYYSDRLMEFPLGVFGVALATVILPSLSEKYASGTTQEFSQMLDWAIRLTLLVCLPATLGLILLAGPMLTTIFQYGEFTPLDVDMATKSLIAYAMGLGGFVLIKVFSSGYFSRQDTRTPVKIGIVAMFSNIILNLVLVGPLAHAGLALATSIAAFINAGLLFYFLYKNRIYAFITGWKKFLIQLLTAVSVMCAVLIYFVPPVTHWLNLSVMDRALQLALWVVSGGLCYIFMLWICGLRPHDLVMSKK